MTEWKCAKCGYNYSGEKPPDVCPFCKEKCEFIDATCYIPDCGFKGRNPNI